MNSLDIKGYRNRLKGAFILLILLTGIFSGTGAEGQYFGRNKPGYKKFNFDVVQTPHFEIYHYLKNDSMINSISAWSEKWYKMHQKIFTDTFDLKNPIILYTNQADFKQTNAVSGEIGTGTGGVTESLKNRVIIPIAPSIAQTDHVLGHELVHAFQYHLFLKKMKGVAGGGESSVNNIPLWMIEGMAEYLSKGSVDPHTSMVMRDALLNNKFPTLKKLSNSSEYFPYTYGQAFWAMVCKTWGDSVMIPILRNTAIVGVDRGIESVLKFNSDALSAMWKSSTQLHYGKYLKNKSDSLSGKKIISDKNAGEMNVSPSLSPDGKYIAFFSEKELFSLDLFLANASNGKILKKLSSVVMNDEIDDFSFIESSGTWSPDSRKFAFVIFSKGVNKLAVLDVRRRKIIHEYEIPGIPSFSNPAWSPDGEKIAFAGQVDGINDLYLFYPGSGKVEKLTDDFTSDLHPSWSTDGQSLVFAKEVASTDPTQKEYSFRVAVMNMNDKSVKMIDVFDDAVNMNPAFSKDNRSIYFLSDADGFRNLYKYDLESQVVYRLTDYMTGISGITQYSPAISIAGDLVAYNYFYNDKYQIYVAHEDEFKAVRADANDLNYEAGTLPPLKPVNRNEIDKTLFNSETLANLPTDSIKVTPYKSKFRLDYISNNANIGVSTGGLYRNNMGGGSVNMIFSDMVGNNQIYSSLSLNGEIYDFGGQVAYLNQGRKLKWGGSVSHIPYYTGGMYYAPDTVTYQGDLLPVDNLILDYMRIFEDNISLFSAYPLSQTRRFEASASTSWYNYRIDRYNNYYYQGINIGATREKQPAPAGSAFQQLSIAYVEDNSNFGMTAPVNGHRSRFQLERYFGGINIYTTLVDYRKYFRVRPFTLAFRFYNYNLLGTGGANVPLPQLYIGSPWYIRGYQNIRDYSEEGGSFNYSLLAGSRVALANAEIRFPLSGPERLALFKSKYFFADLNLFFDSGMAWNKDSNISFKSESSSVALDNQYGTNDIRRRPIYSTGVSLRINFFGYAVIEPYYAFPMQNGGFRNGSFGLNFIPGW